MEPFFIAQTGDTKTADDRAAWIASRKDEAKAEGAQHGRISFDDANNLLLMECWKEAPTQNGTLCEGEPRWQLSAAEHHSR
jgi:hypothetical protein